MTQSTSANASVFTKERQLTGNDLPVLHEIRHALRTLLTSGQTTIIDLRAMPMAPGEEEKIVRTLGEGEISITLNALGISTIRETAIAGVWLITHYNAEDEILGKFIEITEIPELVRSRQEDMQESLERLHHLLFDRKGDTTTGNGLDE